MLESDCSCETVAESPGRISVCFYLEVSFSKGILLFCFQGSYLIGHTTFLPWLIGLEKN